MVLRELSEAHLNNDLVQPLGIYGQEDQRLWLAPYAASAQQFQECKCVFRRGGFSIIVKVNVHISIFFQPALGSSCPFCKSRFAIAGRVFAGVPV